MLLAANSTTDLREPQESVIRAVHVEVDARNRTRSVNAARNSALARPCPRAWRIKEVNLATGSAHVSVIHAICIDETSRRGALPIGSIGGRALARTCPCAWHVIRDESAIGRPQKGVKDIARIYECSRDRAPSG